ncbi:hypothetical protein C0993_000752 [Termitomyces sp. T159_Od127]|nr:hypothetical protein C0993_000752 [Termitomyces sp. T159_Od127]
MYSSTWTDQRFSIEQARTIHDQGNSIWDSPHVLFYMRHLGHHDLVQSPSQNQLLPHQSSSPVGAIVGGIIGGLAVIALAGVIAFYMYRKKKKQNESLLTHVGTDGSKHGRTVSDISQTSVFRPYGYQQRERSLATSPSSQPPLSPTTGTMHTHTASVNSLSYFGSVSHSVIPYGTSLSPPPNAHVISPISQSPSPPPNNQLNRENIIVPFTLPSSHTTSTGLNVNLDAKRADGAIVPVYDSPDSLPPHVVSGDSLSLNTPTRSRVNPPVYTSIDEASIAPSRAHQKTGSGDTNFSFDSKTGDVMSVVQRRGAGGESISAIDDIIGQMGLSGLESVSAGGTLSTGQSGQFHGARPFKPVLGNPDP